MKLLKSLISLCLALTLVFSIANISFAKDETGVDRYIYGPEFMGFPLKSVDIVNAVYGEFEGKQMMYTTVATKPFAKFVAFNLDDNKVEFTGDLNTSSKEGAKTSWSHKIAPNGCVYLVPHGYISIYKYDPKTKELSNSGAPIPGLTAAYGLCVDEESNLYFGTFPVSNVYKYDANLKLVKDYGEIFPGEKYIMSMTYHDGFLYAGGQNAGTKMVKIDIKTGKTTDLPTPEVNGKKFDVASYYMADKVDGKIFATTKLTNGDYHLLVYDIEKNAWVFEYYRAFGHYMAPERNGKTYMIANIPNDPAKGTGIIEIDLKTFETRYTGIPYYGNLLGANWVKLKSHPEMPGESLVTFSREYQTLVAFNIEASKFLVLDEYKLPSEPNHIQDIESGIGNTLLMGSYMGSNLNAVNIDNGEITKFKSTQTETIKRYGNRAYAGCYTQAVLYEYDLTKAPGGDNPKQLGFMKDEKQDRIFDICEIDENLVAVGTYPRVGFETGGIAIFDKSKGNYEFYDTVSPGQSVEGLAYKDGILYGSTSIFVNVTPLPTDEAFVFAFDVNERKLIKKVPVNLEKSKTKNKSIGDLEIGPDGNLWGVTTGAIFCMDPKTMEVTKSVIADKIVPDRKTMSTVSHLMWDKDGYLYADCNGFLIILDPETMKFTNTKVPMQYFTIAEDGNIYFSHYGSEGSYLSKLTVSALNKKQYNDVNSAIGNGIAMMLNKNIASVNGKATYIDKNDKEVIAKEKDGRTLVPVRFISESFGAKVDFDDATSTASIVYGATTIKIKLDDNKIDVNGTITEMDTNAITENGRTLLPLRAICEALNKQVFWDDRGLIVITDEQGKISADNVELVNSCIKYVTEDMPRLLSGTIKL